MFEQHPVPQQISSYQFRLVGDMTLKQFFQLAGGAVLSLITYASPIPGIFKWPLIIFFALAGAALAFLPLEDRPLDRWVIAFFRSAYAPTIYRWKRYEKQPVYFQEDTPPVPGTQSTTTQPQGEPQVRATFLSNLENAEKSFLSSITGLFSGGGSSQPATPPVSPPQQAPKLTPVVEEILIPSQTPIKVEPKPATTQTPPVNIQPPQTPTTQNVSQTLTATQPAEPAQVAQFSPEAAPPLPPTQANVVVGQVMDSTGKIVESAILEIKDTQGRPVRALKTNKAGHFLIVTPLTNGTYQIITEKEGLDFEPIELNVQGEIIPPLAIKAKN